MLHIRIKLRDVPNNTWKPLLMMKCTHVGFDVDVYEFLWFSEKQKKENVSCEVERKFCDHNLDIGLEKNLLAELS